MKTQSKNLNGLMQWHFILICCCLAWLFGALLFSGSANAVSNPVFTKTEELILKTSECEINASTMWAGAIMNSTFITPAQKVMYNNAIEYGYWAVTQERISENEWNAYVDFKEDNRLQPNPTLKLSNGTSQYTYYLEHSGGVGHRGIFLNLNSECEVVATWRGDNIFANVAGNPGTAEPDRLYNFLISTPVTLDTGIDPEWVGEINQEYTPPYILDWIPDINHVQSVDWKIKLQDRNFNTFDPVPFTCDQGLAPIIQYDLYNNDVDPNTPIDQGVFSPTIQYEYQAEDYGVETEFKLIGNYYCGDGEEEPSFSGQKTYYFTLNAIGTFVPDTPSCFSETFPYVDMDGCTAVIENLVNNLSFGAITFPDWEVNSDGCHTLGPLGDWINVAPSSRTVCPQFSSTVRNTVTPFLTFVLGITIIGALISKTRLDSH